MTRCIRSARPGEAALVLQFVRELAAYEKLTDECVSTEAMIDAAVFGAQPRVFCDFAEWNGEVVGFAVWYMTFSTFSGKSGLYLEDLFVRPEHRGKGIGKALMIHLGKKCVENGWGHFQWAVLDWNTPSIDFYKSLGAEMLDEWTGVRVSGDALARLAERT
jgi:GNAT superfamily N-acetyltransferase